MFAAIRLERLFRGARWNPGQRPLAARARAKEAKTTRSYRDDTLILETTHEIDEGAVKVIDFMPVRGELPVLVRIVQGLRGSVPMHTQFVLRYDYGRIVPWVRSCPRGLRAVGGPDAVLLQADVELHGQDLTTVSDFTVTEGQSVRFTLSWYPAHRDPPQPPDADALLAQTEAWWRAWVERSCYRGPWRDPVMRSLITLKALTHAPTGAIVAAPTTSLPEQLGGSRNWDYRYCWLRDATLTLLALLSAGYVDEATDWREWLLRAVAGSPSELQIVYGVAGERRLTEQTLDWLAGYEQSQPVRIGNAASNQFQLDVYGELLDAMYQCRCKGIDPEPADWHLESAIVEFLESAWTRPDEGIWEIRGPRQQLTHSKVMAWTAFDRAVRSIERAGLPGPIDRWRAVRKQIHDDVCRQGYNDELNSFVQRYGGRELDAALLMIPLVGFLPVDDPRVRGTIAAIERELMVDGYLLRYSTQNKFDGLPPGEGVFLPCTFWLADNYVLAGRRDEAQRIFERLLLLRNDVGLLSEEYDPHSGRQIGNFPQALTHIALVNSATNLSRSEAVRARCPA